MTECHQQRDEHQQDQCQNHPIRSAPIEHATHFVEAARSQLDAVDILILLLCIDGSRSIAVTLLHVHLKGLRLDGLVGIGRCIIICELHGRYLILTLISRNHQEVVDHITFHAIGRQFRLVRNLRVILVKILREVGNGLLDELQVSYTAYHHTERYRVIGLDFFLIQLCRDIEFAYAS